MRAWMLVGLLIAVSGCSSIRAPATGGEGSPAPTGLPAAPASQPNSTPAPSPPSAPTVSPAPAEPPLTQPQAPTQSQPPSQPQAPPTSQTAPSVPVAPPRKSTAVIRPAKPPAVAMQAGEPAPGPTPVAATPAPVAATPAPVAAPPAAPVATATLSLNELIQRLRDTRAIGVFTKLSLKNQVDDLLNAFRAFYQGANKTPSAALRQRYDLLLLKVLSLLQDGDPPLAAAISASREAIWGILADPEKFARI